jgi:AraC-like DNA-binding protein
MSERLFVRLHEEALPAAEGNGPGSTMRALPVSEKLRPYVSSILSYRETFPDGREVLERVIPDGAVRIVFNLADPPAVGKSTGFPAEAVGASTRPTIVRLHRRMDGVSVTLRAGGAAALLGLPAGAISGTAVPLTELWRGDGVEALERIGAEADDAARSQVLLSILERRVRGIEPKGQAAATHAARMIALSDGNCALRDVARTIGVGERRLQQLFHAHVGLSPRSWSRLSRLHGCLRALRSLGEPCWAELAIRSGFYDQSHLVNEFRALAGLTPTELHRGGVSGSSKTAR